MAWPLVLIFWVLPIILFFVFRFIQKKTYSDEVIRINQLIYEELFVRNYIEDIDLTEEARELKELYKHIWNEENIWERKKGMKKFSWRD